MSVTRPPSDAAAIPRHIASSVTRMSSTASAGMAPIATVRAASPCQPSTIAPQSIETMSPSAITRSSGMPCTTTSLTVVQIEPGKPWYPLNEGVPPDQRMLSSAIWSSPSVVIPGATVLRSSSNVSPTTSPAARILSIYAGVLISIPRSRNGTSEASLLRVGRLGLDPVQLVEHTRRDRLDTAHPLDAVKQPTVLIDRDEGFGLLVEDVLAVPQHLLGVVDPALDVGPVEQALDELLVVDGEHDDCVHRVAGLAEHLVELLDLGQRAWIPVEQEPVDCVGFVDTVAHHQVGDLVGHVVAGVQVALGFDTQRGLVLDVRPKNVARGNRWDVEVGSDHLGLGALAGTGWTHQDYSHQRRNPS